MTQIWNLLAERAKRRSPYTVTVGKNPARGRFSPLRWPYHAHVTSRGALNSEVSPPGSVVAVAVILWPTATALAGEKLNVPVVPLELVVTLV